MSSTIFLLLAGIDSYFLNHPKLADTKSNINAYAQLGLTQRLSQASRTIQLEAVLPALRSLVA